MHPSYTFQTQYTSNPSAGGRAKSVEEGHDSAKKPKKANSEIRKQQNRIASRNYREKRKKKLQYLQQLIRTGDSTDQEAAEDVEELQGQRVMTLSPSPGYQSDGLAASSLSLPLNSSYSSFTSSNGDMIDIAQATTATQYMNPLYPTTQPYQTFEPGWRTSIYDTPQPVNISSWNVPAWMPSIDYAPPVSSRSEGFQFTPPPHSHHTFDQLPTPPHHSRTPDPDLFIMGSYGHCRRPDGQPLNISSVSLPSSSSSSPFCHQRYPAAP